jgi:hypothetical protein
MPSSTIFVNDDDNEDVGEHDDYWPENGQPFDLFLGYRDHFFLNKYHPKRRFEVKPCVDDEVQSDFTLELELMKAADLPPDVPAAGDCRVVQAKIDAALWESMNCHRKNDELVGTYSGSFYIPENATVALPLIALGLDPCWSSGEPEHECDYAKYWDFVFENRMADNTGAGPLNEQVVLQSLRRVNLRVGRDGVQPVEVVCRGNRCGADVKSAEWLGLVRTCASDSGAPAFDRDGQLAGILSRGQVNGRYSVYVELWAWVQFVDTQMRGAGSGGKQPAATG